MGLAEKPPLASTPAQIGDAGGPADYQQASGWR